jgi:hypothetical protein
VSVRVVELNPRSAEDILRMLTALSTILRAEPFPPGRLYELLEPAIGEDIIRWPDPIATKDLALKADDLRRELSRALGDDLIDERLAAQ